jgi:hypothetical protein
VTPPSPTSEPGSQFEHRALDALYTRVLRDVADRRLDERTRKAAARALAFLLRERFVTEFVATNVLTAVCRSLDLSKVVRTLLLGLVSVSAPEKIAEWTKAVAERALREGHPSSFVSAMRIIVELRDYDGTVLARWRLAIVRAVEVPELAPRVLLFARAYARRFPAESWLWVRRARAVCMLAVLRERVTVAEMPDARQS